MIVKGKVSKIHLSAIDYFADSLLTKQLKKHIIVHVKFRKNLDVLGLVEVEDYNLSGKPREFIIEINRNQNATETLRTLAHEMVHVRQYAYGELNEEGTRWCGKRLERNLEYHEQPWEIEANDVGDIIYYSYMENVYDKRS